ncbi:GNAT family N-acetyltransferase [bacterium]|nr:GNAT family N-acetyltransferase [bacterium]
MKLVMPAAKYLPAYVAALRQGWSMNNLRPEAAREELDAIEQDVTAFLAERADFAVVTRPVILPDGSAVKRVPQITRWMWDGDFCGLINFRWQPGTTALPPTCLGHIGYSIVPWRRRHGLATLALKLLLEELRDMRLEGLDHVEITTDPENIASQRVIEKNGGILIERFFRPPQFGSKEGLRYRIDLKS